MRSKVSVTILLSALLSACSSNQYEFKDYKQLLPRGQISAITNPDYVTADKAVIDDDTYVLGIVVKGEARAYSLNILNNHEVVNDRIGDFAFAAVWWPLANTGVVYDRTYVGKTLTFEASGGLINSSLVMQDRETDSYWSIMRGKSLAGELMGNPLQEVAKNQKMTWGEWRKLHPDSLVLSVNGSEDTDKSYDRYFKSSEGFRGATATDDRLATKAPIFAFRLKGNTYAVAHQKIVNGKSFDVGDDNVFLYRSNSDGLHDSTLAFLGETGACNFDASSESYTGSHCPQPLAGFDTFWYNWSLNNPHTELLD